MKKVLLIMTAIVLSLSIVGCGKQPNNVNSQDNNGDTSQTAQSGQSDLSGANGADFNAAGIVEYDYKDGVLTAIVDENGNPKQNDFIINGVILVGNRHNYFGTDDVEGALANFVKEGYKTEGINSSFYLNEYIGFYMDTQYSGYIGDVKILALPHKTVEEYEKMSEDDLFDLAYSKGFCMDYSNPDENNYKFVAENYVNIDLPEGKYDLLFTYKGKVAYFINVNLTLEPTE